MSANVVRRGVLGRSAVAVGRFTYGFENLVLRQWNEGASLNIGSFCSLASDITIFLGGNHRVDWMTTFPFGHVFQDELGGECALGHPSTKGDVVIGNDVWIGSGATIMSGVRVGDGAVIAARACVVNDVLPYHIVAGNPGRSVKQRFDSKIIEMLLVLKWWELPVSVIKEIAVGLCAEPDEETLRGLISRYRL